MAFTCPDSPTDTRAAASGGRQLGIEKQGPRKILGCLIVCWEETQRGSQVRFCRLPARLRAGS